MATIRKRVSPGIGLRTPNIGEVVRDLERLGTHVAPRAITFALNGVAMEANRRWRRNVPIAMDDPVGFTRSGSEAVKASLVPYARKNFRGARADLSAAVRIKNEKKKDRSAYLAFGMGVKTVRKPGDVGPGKDNIYIPIWRNLRKAEPSIQPIGGANGGLPRNTLKRLIREARGLRAANRGARADGGLFVGRPFRGAGHGIWSRPRRHWDKAAGRTVNEGAPHMLVRIVDQAVYGPYLIRYWNEAMEAAQATLHRRLERELYNEIGYAARNSRRTYAESCAGRTWVRALRRAVARSPSTARAPASRRPSWARRRR